MQTPRFATTRYLAGTFLLVAHLATPLAAELHLGAPFTDHMVLQRDHEIPVWGWDQPETSVTVTLGNQDASTKAAADGKWLVQFPPRAPGKPLSLTVVGSSQVTLRDILIGEVWLCSGQSNMEWTVHNSNNADSEIASGHHPQIRHIKVSRAPAATPQDNVKTTGWQISSPATVGNFTAVGYFFARNLQDHLDIPIGLIGSNWGGTRIEPWISPAGFKEVPALREIADHLSEYPKHKEDGTVNHQSAMALYNGMIHPLVPYPIRGAIWYQGESNNGEGMLYHEKMKALISGWRTVWQEPQMPFYFVQLAPFRYGGNPTRLPGIWDAQRRTLAVPHTGMAVTTDIGDVLDIHPTNKQDVGKRLALWALARTYQKEVGSYSGPLYKTMKVEGNHVRIFFDYTDGGLLSRDGKPLSWFTIAGPNQQFAEATATIDGDTVVVQADEVSEPQAVRFGWHQEAEPNLANKAGLPASPFRSDNW
jgi:sialate O-acetylesterase